METRKNKMCKVRLRRLRPDMMEKLKARKDIAKSDVHLSSSSSESDAEETNEDGCEKLSVQIKSPLTLGSNKDFDPYIILSEAQAALNMSSENKSIRDTKDSLSETAVAICSKMARVNNVSDTTSALTSDKKINGTPKLSKNQKPFYYSSLEMASALSCSNNDKLKSTIESDIYDLIYYHSEDETPCSYNCSHVRKYSNVSNNAIAPTDIRSSSGSSTSSDKCSIEFSKLLKNNCISVMDHENPPSALSKILSIKEFDPLAPQQIIAIVIKSIVSLSELSRRDENIVSIDIDKKLVLDFSAMSLEEKRNCHLNPYMDVSNIIVTHSEDEFLTFCLCENCEKYREFVIHIMVEQFKATHMVVMLLDVLIQYYGPMLKNVTAYNKFKKLLDSNKEIYWITCGVIYHKKAEHLDFIYDEYLSDNMIFVLFSSILMLNNPLLLLQILAFHVECIVKAYAEGFLEIVEPDKNKIPADEIINYILNGYDELMRISDQVASYLFAFENDFLRKFSLTWKLLSQRLYQQHVHLHLADTMLAYIITLKEEELTSHHTELIRRYIQFDDVMNHVEKRWTDVWIELNKFNLSEVERKRRKSLLDVYRIFDTVVQDAIGFSLQDSVDDNDFYDFRFLKNRRLAWKNIMSYTKMKWPDGFFQPPNSLVVDDKCQTCNISLEYHADYCKCITCSIAGGPLPPKRNAEGKCSKCLAHEIVKKDINFYDSKILNVCANDDFENLMSKNSKPKSTALRDVGHELCPSLALVGDMININEAGTNSETIESANSYHISWAVFNHLNNRKRYPYTTIEEQYFCCDCKQPSCLLALKILNNEISPSLSQDLVHYYQPLSMSREELRSILPNIMLYNRKLVASNNGLDLIDVHDLVVKIYWIFVISIYAIYFIDYDDDIHTDSEGNNYIDCNKRDKEKKEVGKEKPGYLESLELTNNDIKVKVKNLIGNKDDIKFLEFLNKVKSFEVGDRKKSDEMQKKLNKFFKISESGDTSSSSFKCENIPPPAIVPTEDEDIPQPCDSSPTTTVEAQPKKTTKDKTRKCCFDHSETGGEHCKENHASKKKLKKDCNHVRMNETRERLRKKLSQIVTARKNSKHLQLAESSQNSNATPSQSSATDYILDARYIMEHFLNPEELKLLQHCLPRPDFCGIHDFISSFDHIYNEAKRNEEKKNLCECLQNFKTNSKSDPTSRSNTKIQPNHQQTQPQQAKLQLPSPQEEQKLANEKVPSLIQQSLSIANELPNKKANMSNNSTRDASASSQGTKTKENSSTNAPSPISSSKAANNLDFVNEICEIIDNYSKEQAKRKWIKETLSFIEGPPTSSGKKKTQPQTLNPKKAAKKAKQKQRKEEEKRIAELQDLRAQFHNIYFKEFSEKHSLKALKANKKRDKKKMSELENNIKNLQRAKAKVETAILELIATVKQTNSEFKFSYLPTKEQQLDKIRELEGHCAKETDRTIKVRNLLHQAAKDGIHIPTSNAPSSPFTVTPTNNLNMVPESYSMPYAHANHFAYNLGFPTPSASVPFGLLRASPMCYTPPTTASASPIHPQTQLPPDVVAAMNSNAASNNNTDPSKRIVTIRRVNLPNVPEPQVTVTAKGSSPDKDKLLYTFINGQLIQTGTAPPITIPQLPTVASMQSQIRNPISMSQEKLTAEHMLSIPPPPPPTLSKTQMKKERKRLAKLQAEKEAAEEAERKQIAAEHQKLRELKEQKQLETQRLHIQHLQQKAQTKKKKKTSQTQTLSKSSNHKDLSNQNKKNNLLNSNSTTSISTNENIEAAKLPQIMAVKSSGKPKRNDSTTTSCSAATSTSSNNSTSSQMNTRDNSVSSLRPADKIGTSKGQKLGSTPKTNNANKNIKTKAMQLKQKQNKKPTRIPPTPSTTSSETDDEDEPVLPHKSTPPPPPAAAIKTKSQPVSKAKVPPKQNQMPQKLKPAPKPITPPSSESESEELLAAIEPKQRKHRRPKLVDNGQFDNNPFKSLHMQDSETEYSSEEDSKIEVAELISKTRKIPAAEKKVTQRSDKDKNCIKPTTNSLRKNLDPAIVESKVKQSPTNLHPENKNLSNKNSKNTKNAKHQKQDEKSKQNNAARETQGFLDDPIKSSLNQYEILKANTQQNFTVTNNRKGKASNTTDSSNQAKLNTTTFNNRNEKTTSTSNSRNNGSIVNRCTNSKTQNKPDHSHLNPSIHMVSGTSDNAENKNQPNKRSQRNKKYQQKSQKHPLSLHQNHNKNCSSGIPNHMGYFNAHDINLTSASASHTPVNVNAISHNLSQQSLAEQMEALRISGHQVQTTSAMTTDQQRQQHINSANVSIMDQLNRGVQVENLSLPPGITLTKVDPLKSEQLRQKSESIKKLAKPLQQQQAHHLSQSSHAFHHSSSGTTIIAPPVVNPITSFYGSSYINSASAGLAPQGGVIMVEANPAKISNMAQANVINNCASKQSKNKKRRNKSKAKNNLPCSMKNGSNNENSRQPENNNNGQPKMITLKNPMFHSGPTAAATTMLQQPAMLTGCPVDGFPLPVPLPVDQPAAIIKNENGMYTIRNPALHQAVTSGLTMGGYRQFSGNVNYYTPQEAAAEAARATLKQQKQIQQQQHHRIEDKSSPSCGSNPSSYSYFSNEAVQANKLHNNISISCTSISGAELNSSTVHAQRDNNIGGLIGDAAVIQRPAPHQQRPISAIGSEIKSAQQQKQKTQIEQWSNFVSDTSLPINNVDKCCNTSYLRPVSECGASPLTSTGGGVVPANDLSLQEKYQQSKYYNGFDVFTGSSGGSSSSAATCAHMQHNCGDDSPPPTISCYNSYLDGIPNTGVIRYDDASFLKNLIPGQNLNNEVSIHNANDSNFARNDQSHAHRVEITPVFANRPSSAGLYESSGGQGSQSNFRGNYRDTINEYNNDTNTIFPNNMHLNLSELESSLKYDFEETAPASVADDNSHNTILTFDNLLIKNGATSRRTSPYLDENTLEGFVQNMNSLHISSTSCEEQSSQLNGSGQCVREGTSAASSSNNTSNGWW